jgi:predicted 3-demethylubiquinone-9 3-methyltransferase (glyoxalase superfamily)
MSKITPFLWFDNNVEEAMNFYFSVFKNGKVKEVTRYGDAGPGPKGSVMTASFELDGQEFVGLNGGPRFKFTEAVSFVIRCKDQSEVDYYWDKLTSGGGQPVACGWLRDKFGLSWQVVPVQFFELVQSKDPAAGQRVMKAMMGMTKMNVKELQAAHDAKS